MSLLDDAGRRRILDFVKPLAAGLDGVTNFGDVHRVLRACAAIGGQRPDVDPDRLFLLAVFSGQEKWARQFGQGSRLELFLASAGVSSAEIQRLKRSLPRFAKNPRTPEEEIAHDARRLEQIGAYGVAHLVARGYQERMDFDELSAEIEKEALGDFRTERGRALAAPRLTFMRDFARGLRRELEEFGS